MNARARRRTWNVAHRGASGTHPENTISAFKKAVEIGVDMIEFDVWPTRDGYPVLIHDASVDRTSDGRGKVIDMSLEEIQKLDAGSWKGEQFAGERIPTLGEALPAIDDGTFLNIHLKFFVEGTFLERFTSGLTGRGSTDGVLVAPDNLDAIPLLRRRCPSLQFILLDGRYTDEEYVAKAVELGIKTLQPSRRRMSRGFMELVHERGLRANVFCADTFEDMRLYIDMGVDGILTNFPERLKALLKKERCGS